MRRIFIIILSAILLCGAYDLQAQSKTTKKTSTSSKKGKKPAAKPEVQEVQLPANSNDCLYAIDLKLDVPYGPTTAPQGAGRMQEIMRDRNNPNIFDYEHNSVWFKFVVPYNGDLNFYITPTNPTDDYKFIVYKYTDVYFSNNLIQNKIKPKAACLGSLDSAFIAANTRRAPAKGTTRTGTTAQQRPSQTTPKTTHPRTAARMLGMDSTGHSLFIGEKGRAGFVKPIPVKKGEVYYIVLDNNTEKGAGFTIRANIHVDFFRPTVQFYDSKDKKYVDVDLLILEKNTDNRPIVKNNHFRTGKVNLVPGFNYTLYAKKDGYFPIYKEFNSNFFKEDTLMRFIMQPAKVGTVFPITDIYFSDNVELLSASDTALLSYVTMFRNYPELQFRIKGYVQSYGIDMDRDIQISQERANVVRQFFIEHGIDANRMTVAGMTQNEIKRSAAAALNKSKPFNDAKVEITITSIKE